MSQRTPPRESEYLPASKLAAMGYCETQMLLEKRYGKRQTKAQAKASREGRQEHARFDRVVVSEHNRTVASSQDKRCFIATAVYGGSDPRTQSLRDWRDLHLAPHWWGRICIWFYYATSPWIAGFLAKHESLARPVRYGLDVFRKFLKLTDHKE